MFIDATATAGPLPIVFGMDLVERLLRGVREVGVTPEEVVVALAPGGAEPEIHDDLRDFAPVRVARDVAGVGAALAECLGAAAPVLAIHADAIFDARLAAQLAGDATSRVFASDDSATDDERGVLLWLQPEIAPGLSSSLSSAGTTLDDLASVLLASGAATPLRPEDFQGYITMLRRDLPPYLFRIRDDAARKRVERFLFWSNYKGSTDFMTRYVYPPFVWWMVRPLARWRVHPNLVTYVDIAATFAAVPFFWVGAWLPGLFLAYLMSVLDSVDGKLARVTFTSSKIGEVLDHGLDIVHPPIWYMAWGFALGGGSYASAPWLASLWMLGMYVGDRIVTGIFKWRHGKSIHGFTEFDERMRTFISRRNVNLPFFTIALAIDWLRGDTATGGWAVATATFYVIVAWQAACLLFHGDRLVRFWKLGGRKLGGRELGGERRTG